MKFLEGESLEDFCTDKKFNGGLARREGIRERGQSTMGHRGDKPVHI